MKVLGTGAATVNILFQIGSYRTIIFDFGVDVSLWTFEFILRDNKGSRVKIISLTLGSGLSFPVYLTDQLQATFSAVNSNIREGEYFWELRRTDLNVPIANGSAFFSFDAPDGNIETTSLEFTYASQIIQLDVSNLAGVTALEQESYSTTLLFDGDKEIFKDATGLSPSFTLASSGNVNGMGIILRLNKPTAVTFPGNFEADANSATLDATKMNVYTLIYFANWNGSGTARVIYSNHLFTAV